MEIINVNLQNIKYENNKIKIQNNNNNTYNN